MQNRIADINSSSRCMLDKDIIDQFSLQYFLLKPIPCIYRKQLSNRNIITYFIHRQKDAPEIFCVMTKYVGSVDPKLRMNVTLS